MKTLQNIILATFFTGFVPFFTFAQTPDPCPDPGTFGCFEVGLPGIETNSIDSFLDDPKPILKFTNLAVQVVIAIAVIIGVISIVIGGYMYMTAGGDGGRVKMAKEMIVAALVGILLSLISVVILNTINKYLGTEAQEPKLGGSPAPAAGGAPAGGGPGPQSRGSLPINNTPTNSFSGANNVPLPEKISLTKQRFDTFVFGSSRIDTATRNVFTEDLKLISKELSTLPNTPTTTDLFIRYQDLENQLKNQPNLQVQN